MRKLALFPSALTFETCARPSNSDEAHHVHSASTSPILSQNEIVFRLLRAGGGKSTPTLRKTPSMSQMESTYLLPSSAKYVHVWPEAARSELLSTVCEICRAASPSNNMFGDELLDNEVVLLSGDREMLLLQSTLVLASNSDLDRGYKSHLEWSDARIRKLRSSSPVDGNGDEASTFFCFAPENADKLSQILLSITSLRLPKSQSWVIRHVKVPFVALWER